MFLKNIIPFGILLLMASCSKTFQQKDVDFEVGIFSNAQVATSTFKANDTVNFRFSGNPDHITFFSGEKGRNYLNKDRVKDTSTNVLMAFSTTINTLGTSGKLSLMMSTDFKGYTQNNAIDSLNVPLATWTDISSRAIFPVTATTTLSGAVNLSDLAVAGKPVFLAFKYLAAAGATQSKFTINTIGVRHITSDTAYTIDSSSLIIPVSFPTWAVSPGWGAVNIANTAVKFSPNVSAQTATAFAVGGTTVAATAVNTEHWIISGPLDFSRVLPDAGVTIKDMTSNAAAFNYGSVNAGASTFGNYAYKFTRAGTYTLTFLASNDSRDNQNAIVKTYTITIQ